MNLKRVVLAGMGLVGLLPIAARAELVFVGPSQNTGQGFGNVINVLTLQKTDTESGQVLWTGSADQINGCSNVAQGCVGPDTGATPGAGKTATQTFSTVGWQSAADIAVTFNANQTGSNEPINVTQLVMNVYNTDGSVAFTASLPGGHLFPDIFQGTGTGFFIFALDSTEQAAAQAALFGANFDANRRVGLQASVSLSNDGPDTFGVANANGTVPEPGFYGTLALGLAGLVFYRRRRQKA